MGVWAINPDVPSEKHQATEKPKERDNKARNTFEEKGYEKHEREGYGFIEGGKEPASEIPFAFVEQPPVYPGCKADTPEILRNCLSRKIGELINEDFNKSLIDKGSLD